MSIPAKQAHAADILSAVATLKALIVAEPDLYFGGLPASLVNLYAGLDAAVPVISEAFALNETPVFVPPPLPPGGPVMPDNDS